MKINFVCSVFKKGIAKRICNITYDKRCVSENCLIFSLNNICVATFYNCTDYEFLEDRTYIFI